MLAGRAIIVFVAPRVGRKLIAFEVRAGPIRNGARFVDERIQAFSRVGIPACVEVVQIERFAKIVDLQPGALDFARLEITENPRADEPDRRTRGRLGRSAHATGF